MIIHNLSFGFEQFGEPHCNTLIKLLHKIDHIEKPKILEIGCWAGQSTSILAQYAKEKGGQVWVIDTFKGSEETGLEDIASKNNILSVFYHNMQKLNLLHLINLRIGKSQEVAHSYPNLFFDFIFIDGDHRYQGIKADLDLYCPKLQSGGLICGHDYEGGGYDPAYIYEDFAINKHHGVIKAVNDKFGKEVKQEFVFWYVEYGKF